jgi:uncharacterized protein (TIGR02266 family)
LLTSGRETHKAGEIIFEEGSHGFAVYILSSGKVEISKVVQGKKIVLEALGPGDMFGEMSYLDPAPRSATATALEDTVLELLDKDFLDKEFNQISSDFREIIRGLVRRLRKTSQNLAPSPRRSEERARARARIRVSFKNVKDFLKVYSSNIGGGGLFIKTTKTLPVGTILDLELDLPEITRIMRTKSKVVWTRSQDESTEKAPPGIGAEFIDMDPEDKRFLKDYVASLSPSSH